MADMVCHFIKFENQTSYYCHTLNYFFFPVHVGNMIGPVVSNLINGGLEKLLRMPTGCGEQTMIYMSPNVYVLQYLSNTRQVTASVEAKAYKFIQSGSIHFEYN